MLDSAKTNEALDEMRKLLQADGGDIDVVELDLEAAIVRIRLILEGARCRECVLPSTILENVVGHIMKDHGVAMQRIVIEDPRDVGA